MTPLEICMAAKNCPERMPTGILDLPDTFRFNTNICVNVSTSLQ